MRPPVSLAGLKIKPGRQATIQVPVARLYTHTEMTMPVHVIHGYRDGPRLFVSAAIHGDEIIGTEIIRRLMKLKKIKFVRT
jgi:predicted deacylase